jgi:hypothetical protein
MDYLRRKLNFWRGGVIGVDSKKVDVCEIGEKFEQENSASEE